MLAGLPTATSLEPASWWICAGMISISPPAVCMYSMAKGGITSVHPVGARESRALRRLQRETKTASPYVFVSERGAPFSAAEYQRMVARAGEAARFSFLIHT